MSFASQNFARCFTDPVATVAPHERSVIQVELQQIEIAMANCPAQEKIATEAAVDAFDQRAGAMRGGKRVGHE